MSGPGITALIFSKEEMNDATKIVQLLDLLITDASETIINEAKKQKGRFLSMLLGTLGASFLGKLLTDKQIKGLNKWTIRAV